MCGSGRFERGQTEWHFDVFGVFACYGGCVGSKAVWLCVCVCGWLRWLGCGGLEQARESGILRGFNSLKVMHMWLGCLVMWYGCYECFRLRCGGC